MFCLGYEEEDLQKQITIIESRNTHSKSIKGSRVYQRGGSRQRKARAKSLHLHQSRHHDEAEAFNILKKKKALLR